MAGCLGTEGIARFTVRLVSGRNDLLARGVGYRGIEGPPSSVLTVAVTAAPTRPALRMVAIGINDYVRPDWELFYARNDAVTVVSALQERGGGLFADVQPLTLLDASADKSTIEARILESSHLASRCSSRLFLGPRHCVSERRRMGVVPASVHERVDAKGQISSGS